MFPIEILGDMIDFIGRDQLRRFQLPSWFTDQLHWDGSVEKVLATMFHKPSSIEGNRLCRKQTNFIDQHAHRKMSGPEAVAWLSFTPLILHQKRPRMLAKTSHSSILCTMSYSSSFGLSALSPPCFTIALGY